LFIYHLETDSSIVHLLLRKLIKVLSICRLETDSSIVHLSLRN
jgi:Arc/MetJ family transcription regulator